MKRQGTGITPEKALHMAALVQDLWNVSKKVITNDLKSPDVFHLNIQNTLELIRMRTKHYYEYIITQTPGG